MFNQTTKIDVIDERVRKVYLCFHAHLLKQFALHSIFTVSPGLGWLQQALLHSPPL